MCFSAGASFGAGVVLSVVGVASVKKAQSRSEAGFASIPLIFGVQQIAEGCVWLSLTNPSFAWLESLSTYSFLFFAQVLWPFWVPFAFLLLEKEKGRRYIQWALLGIGAVVSAYLAYCLASFPVVASIREYHISYALHFPPGLSEYGSLFYIIATVAPPFFSHIKRMWLLGTAIFISYLITLVFYTDYVISVWCFFAALLSVMVYFLMSEVRKANAGMKPQTHVISE